MFQETKLRNVDDALARYLGGYKLDSQAAKPSRGTRGGILLLWNSGATAVRDVRQGHFSLLATITVLHYSTDFGLTTIYGPTRHVEKMPSSAT